MATENLVVWAVDPAHTSIDFTVRHLVIAKVRGAFRVDSGTIEIPEGGKIPAAITVKIDAKSIDTREPQRDDHLRSADFLDAETYPFMEFKSTSVAPNGETEFTVTGDLTLHGTTKSVQLKGEYEGAAKDPWGNDRVAYSATGRINRKDFGLTWNQTLETGGVMVGEDLDITISVQAIKPKAA